MQADIAKQTFYRWRKEYGGLEIVQEKKLKYWRRKCPLEKAATYVVLDNAMLKGIAEENF